MTTSLVLHGLGGEGRTMPEMIPTWCHNAWVAVALLRPSLGWPQTLRVPGRHWEEQMGAGEMEEKVRHSGHNEETKNWRLEGGEDSLM